MAKRRPRIITLLRRAFSGRWDYNWLLHRWEHEDGWAVEPRAALAPKFDGDDDSFVTRYYRTDNGEEVCLGDTFSQAGMMLAKTRRKA